MVGAGVGPGEKMTLFVSLQYHRPSHKGKHGKKQLEKKKIS
jgi:hypothetical protein